MESFGLEQLHSDLYSHRGRTKRHKQKYFKSDEQKRIDAENERKAREEKRRKREERKSERKAGNE
jgi:hypothetical protein